MNVESTIAKPGSSNAGSQTPTRQPVDQASGKVSFLRTFFSVIMASFGVQSEAKRQRDFENGSIAGFVAAALIFMLGFVGVLAIIVSVVLD